ncbi:GNAT family N-acetyltransferase, partial [bacterium]|nr:GNAT family N-acetyltransferase [bacterium]
ESRQGRGYGRAAVIAALDYIRTKPFGSSNRVLLTCNPENRVAWGLYKALGFTGSGRADDEETELEYTV